MAKIKDTDYLAVSARIRAMENTLLTSERLERLLEAQDGDEAARLLQESGYPPLDPARPEEMDAALSQVRGEILEDLSGGIPDERYIDLFKLKYDYHNAKVLLKTAALGLDPARMLMDLGRVHADQLRAALAEEEGAEIPLPPTLARGIAQAREVLAATRDPQLSDLTLDKWMYTDMRQVAQATGSAFLQGYVTVQVDVYNLRSLVRTVRMGKGADFLASVLLAEGSIPPEPLLKAAESGGSGLTEHYASTPLEAAARSGVRALGGESLTTFEKCCDDAVSAYLAGARMVPFGEAPLLGYLAAREREYTNIRILLMGRAAGLSPEVIRARLRGDG